MEVFRLLVKLYQQQVHLRKITTKQFNALHQTLLVQQFSKTNLIVAIVLQDIYSNEVTRRSPLRDVDGLAWDQSAACLAHAVCMCSIFSTCICSELVYNMISICSDCVQCCDEYTQVPTLEGYILTQIMTVKLLQGFLGTNQRAARPNQNGKAWFNAKQFHLLQYPMICTMNSDLAQRQCFSVQ